jgi:hypothetical protein
MLLRESVTQFHAVRLVSLRIRFKPDGADDFAAVSFNDGPAAVFAQEEIPDDRFGFFHTFVWFPSSVGTDIWILRVGEEIVRILVIPTAKNETTCFDRIHGLLLFYVIHFLFSLLLFFNVSESAVLVYETVPEHQQQKAKALAFI